MAEHDFTALYERFPEVLNRMDNPFTSHQFIHDLSWHYQDLYVEALYAYRHSLHQGMPTPFKVVHGILANRLAHLPELEYLGNVDSEDIFDNSNRCAQWRKR